jgi:hypothetical protein
LWTNRLPRLDVLSEEQAEAIHHAALTLLEEIGVRFAFEPALRRFRDAGVDVYGDLVDLDRGFVAEAARGGPARVPSPRAEPRRSFVVGGDHLALAPTGGAPFVLDPDRGRRPPTAEDHAMFVRFTHAVPVFDLNESGIVEPDDLPVPTRHLDMDLDVLRWSDKPYFPVGATYESSRDSVDLAAMLRWPRGDRRAPRDARDREPDQPAVVRRAHGGLGDRVRGGRPARRVHAVRGRRRDGAARPRRRRRADGGGGARRIVPRAARPARQPGRDGVVGLGAGPARRAAAVRHGVPRPRDARERSDGAAPRLPFRGAAGSRPRRRRTSVRCRSRSWRCGRRCSRART